MSEDLSLTDFLLARIAEDEVAARGATKLYRAVGEHENVYGEWVPIIPLGGDDRAAVERTADFYRERGARNVEVVVFYDPDRVLAGCEAKRRIVHEHSGPDYWESPDFHLCRDSMIANSECETLRALALPYADHPDYRVEWRP